MARPEPYVTWLERSRLWPWNRAKFLRHLPVRAREDLWTFVSRRSGHGQRGCLAVGPGIVFCLVAVSVFPEVGLPPVLDSLLRFAFVLALPAVILFATQVGTERAVRAIVVDRLGDERLPICLLCGYELRGLADDTVHCPECGAPIVGQASIEAVVSR